ncbi:hypothetical protein ACONUD_02710 [Microbulbifer harenosus]|uniref:Uncharacterized protein n=1 Tax=Microbulbifer harenosus TaxID=2576840 RepID=A0ABY2UCX8_9GAMM|nr:hypothetical protein [Microbulbifer harenosus]TLM73433.1 hypothetical protein FDY93_18950 [Microbulbifer harenosus]
MSEIKKDAEKAYVATKTVAKKAGKLASFLARAAAATAGVKVNDKNREEELRETPRHKDEWFQ